LAATSAGIKASATRPAGTREALPSSLCGFESALFHLSHYDGFSKTRIIGTIKNVAEMGRSPSHSLRTSSAAALQEQKSKNTCRKS
jgi:hypothetical protein